MEVFGGQDSGKRKALFLEVGLILVLFLSAVYLFSETTKAANPPTIITYQGKLLVNNLSATTTQSIKFVLYDALTGGNVLYTAGGTTGAPTAISITPSSGIFSVDLGGTGTNSLSPTLFKDNASVYLEVAVGSETLTPRKQITAVPYSFNSKYLDGVGTNTVSTTAYIPVSGSDGSFIFNTTTLATTTLAGPLTMGTSTDYLQGRFYVDSATGNVSATGSLRVFGNVTSTGVIYGLNGLISSASSTFTSGLNITGNTNFTGHLYPGTDNLYDIGASSTQWRYGNFQGGLLIADGSTTSTLDNSKLIIAQGAADNLGKFYIDSSGNVSSSGTLQVLTTDVGIPTALFTTADGNVRIATSTDMDSNYSLIIGKDSMGSLGAIMADGNIIPMGDGFGFGDLGSSAHRWGYGYFSNILYVGSDWSVAGTNITVDGTSGFMKISNSSYSTSTYADAYTKLGQKPNEFGMLDNGRIYLNSGLGFSVVDPYIRLTNNTVTSTLGNDSLKIGQTAFDDGFGNITYDVGKIYFDGSTGNMSASGTLYVNDTLTLNGNATDFATLNFGAMGTGMVIDSGGTATSTLTSTGIQFQDALSMITLSTAATTPSLGIIDTASSNSMTLNYSGLNFSATGTIWGDDSSDSLGNTALVLGSNSDMTNADTLRIVEAVSAPENNQRLVIDANGGFILNRTNGSTDTGKFYVDSSGNVSASGTLQVFGNTILGDSDDAGGDTTRVYGSLAIGAAPTGNAQLYISASSTAAIPVIIQGSTGGTDTSYDYLTQWHDSSGNIIVSLSTSTLGSLAMPFYNPGGGLSIVENALFTVGSDSRAGFVDIKGSGGILLRDTVGNVITFLGPNDFEMGNAIGTVTSTYSNTDLKLFMTSGYDRGTFYLDSSGNVSASGTLRVYSSTAAGGLEISGTDSTTTLTSYVANAGGSTGFAFNVLAGSTALSSSTDRMLIAFQNNGTNKVLISGGGNVYAKESFIANSADYGIGDVAEYINLSFGEIVNAGDVMAVDENDSNKYRKSSAAYATNVAGVISDTGAFVIGASGQGRAPLALVGLVKVKVNNQNGPIAKGDLLVTASEPGYAMKYDSDKDDDDKIVAIIGIATEPLDGDRGVIKVLLRTGWMNNRNQAIVSLQQNLQELAAVQGVNLNSNTENLNIQNNDGQLTYSGGNLNLGGYGILNVSSILAVNSKWAIDEGGNFIVRYETANGQKEMYGLQSPAAEFVFSGSSQLIDGEAVIVFEPEVQEIIDMSAPLKVTVTLTSGEAKGIYVSQKDATGFTVKELQNGKSNATFDWIVVAKRRAAETNTDLAQTDADQTQNNADSTQNNSDDTPTDTNGQTSDTVSQSAMGILESSDNGTSEALSAPASNIAPAETSAPSPLAPETPETPALAPTPTDQTPASAPQDSAPAASEPASAPSVPEPAPTQTL